ncbi:thermonuclease family protein [Victivallis vadensis]|uniref:thermonuclease family protein n=1 Tax=Victivallis vadensis TaxID=172901 RepID=UPI0023F9D401|nr:thermonuclease family protein [Victivallis vadensis]
MRKLIAILFLLLAVVAQTRADTLRARVLWIHDGDTVSVAAPNGLWFKVRLWGVDAPELDQPGGRDSMMALIRLVGRKQVTVDIKDRDRYGRLVGVIIYRKKDINLEMLKLGQAWYYKQYAPKQKSYAEAEAEAREKRRGLWSESDPVAPWEWRKQQRQKKKPGAPSEERPADESVKPAA